MPPSLYGVRDSCIRLQPCPSEVSLHNFQPGIPGIGSLALPTHTYIIDKLAVIILYKQCIEYVETFDRQFFNVILKLINPEAC